MAAGAAFVQCSWQGSRAASWHSQQLSQAPSAFGWCSTGVLHQQSASSHLLQLSRSANRTAQASLALRAQPLVQAVASLDRSPHSHAPQGAANNISSSQGLPSRLLDHRDTETRLLREEIRELRNLVQSQHSLVEQQMQTINQLKSLVQTAPDQLTGAPTWQQPGRAASLPGPGSSNGNGAPSPFEAQLAAIGDRRFLGMYDARFHSTNWGATPRDHRVLPARIVLLRHAESEGNVDNFAYTYTPDPQVPLTERGHKQALAAGVSLRRIAEAEGPAYQLYFYTSPYTRSHQTYQRVAAAFDPAAVAGAQEEVQLREQDFGNFQDAEGKQREKAERLRFGRFFYRFPNGESGADVYDRMTIFEDHLIRDINAGRFSNNTTLVLVTHGLALRIFLMRWFHWTVDQFLNVYNPPNAIPLVLERVPSPVEGGAGGPASWVHTKALYRLTEDARDQIRGCTDEMCSTSCQPDGCPIY